ncbi:MAG: tetratricopeptide repeat protein [Prolixibacteraceae bacterium]|nr:tetratricopeptide repeat protein [Prolixibacteraceae bacterium]
MGKSFDDARMLFQQNDLDQSLEVLNQILRENSGDVFSLNLRARIHYKMQRWGKAMNDYASALEIDPENQEAKSGIEMAKSILGYFTPDMFNP